MGSRDEARRFGFLEGEDGVSLQQDTAVMHRDCANRLDYIDFKSDTKVLPYNTPKDDMGDPIPLKTRGETSVMALKKILWIIVRVAIVTAIALIYLRGSTCGRIEFT